MTKATAKRIAKLFGELCAKHGVQPVSLGESMQTEGALSLVCRAAKACGLIQLPTTLRGNQAEKQLRSEFPEMLGKLREAVAA